MKHFSELTPWPTMRGQERTKHFGLLPTFNLDEPVNILAWNRIRLYLLTYETELFTRRQLSLSGIFLVSLGILAMQIKRSILLEEELYNNLIVREPVSTGLTTILFDQISMLVGLGSIMFIGVRMTAIQTNTLRFILLMKKGQLYTRPVADEGEQHPAMYFSANCRIQIDIKREATLKQIRMFLDETFGVRVQDDQLSLERKHLHTVSIEQVAKRCVQEVEAALGTKQPDAATTTKLASFSRDLREYAPSLRWVAEAKGLLRRKQQELQDIKSTVERRDAQPGKTGRPRMGSWSLMKRAASNTETLGALAAGKESKEEWTSQHQALLELVQAELELYELGPTVHANLEKDKEQAPMDLLFRHCGRRMQTAKDGDYLRLSIDVRDGRDLNMERVQMSLEDIAQAAKIVELGNDFSRENSVVSLVSRDSTAVGGRQSESTRTKEKANIEACGEMLRGLAEILEEERLLNPAIVDTLEDVRCRLQIVPKVTVPLTKEFAGGVVSVLLGGLLSTVQILHSTSSFESDEFDI